MATRSIIQLGDPALYQVAEPVTQDEMNSIQFMLAGVFVLWQLMVLLFFLCVYNMNVCKGNLLRL